MRKMKRSLFLLGLIGVFALTGCDNSGEAGKDVPGMETSGNEGTSGNEEKTENALLGNAVFAAEFVG